MEWLSGAPSDPSHRAVHCNWRTIPSAPVISVCQEMRISIGSYDLISTGLGNLYNHPRS